MARIIFSVSHRSNTQLKQHPLMAEYRVLEKDLLDDLVGIADEVRAAQGSGRFKLLAGDAGPAALAADLVHHQRKGGKVVIRRLFGIVCEEAVGIDAQGES